MIRVSNLEEETPVRGRLSEKTPHLKQIKHSSSDAFNARQTRQVNDYRIDQASNLCKLSRQVFVQGF